MMATLTTLPWELQYSILSHLTHVSARLHHRAFYACEGGQPPHPLLSLALVSQYFNTLVEEYSEHLLQSLHVRFPTSSPNITTTTTTAAGNFRSTYISHARTHCHMCDSSKSVTSTVLGADNTPVCFLCDWPNWQRKMRAHPAAANIYVVERVAVLIPLDLLWGFSDMRREVRARRGNARRHRGFRVKPLSADMVGEEHLKMVREDLVRAIEDYSEIAVDLVWRVGNRLV